MHWGRQELGRTAPALVAGFTIVIVFGAVLSIVLTAAGPDGMRLSDRQTSGWIALVYGLPMIPSLVLTLRYRMPLLLTGNIFALIFFASLGDRVPFAELAAAAMLAGAIVLLIAVLGLTGRLAGWIPAPIVQGLIAGAVCRSSSTSSRRSARPTDGPRSKCRSWWGRPSWPISSASGSSGRGSRRSCPRSSSASRWLR